MGLIRANPLPRGPNRVQPAVIVNPLVHAEALGVGRAAFRQVAFEHRSGHDRFESTLVSLTCEKRIYAAPECRGSIAGVRGWTV